MDISKTVEKVLDKLEEDGIIYENKKHMYLKKSFKEKEYHIDIYNDCKFTIINNIMNQTIEEWIKCSSSTISYEFFKLYIIYNINSEYNDHISVIQIVNIIINKLYMDIQNYSNQKQKKEKISRKEKQKVSEKKQKNKKKTNENFSYYNRNKQNVYEKGILY